MMEVEDMVDPWFVFFEDAVEGPKVEVLNVEVGALLGVVNYFANHQPDGVNTSCERKQINWDSSGKKKEAGRRRHS
jgi:hypothetical protein